ncbi:hypothetical protein F52700_11766 [Fusarium sp. NRRL 52700]|nr:hypothetical protein F52700_11766 [Fusarium sp. NRRL 52700]
MVHSLYIPPCLINPTHHHHPPPVQKSLRIQIEGPLVSIERLLPNVPWHVDVGNPIFPQPAARKLAELTYRALYGNNALLGMESRLAVRDEYLGWIHHKNEIDYYGVTFDNNVPSDEYFPEVLQINIMEIEADEGEYANEYLPFTIDPADYIGKKILAPGETWLQEFRAIWVESDLLSNVAVSGVGRWGNSYDEFSGTAPVDPKNRYDDDAGPGTTIDVALTPHKPTIFTRLLDENISAWGYGFHASCWNIFTKDSTPNLGHLFAACLSMPTGQEPFLNWGHDYGGASILKKPFKVPTRDTRFPDPRTIPNLFRSNPFHIPALARAIQQTTRLQNDVFLSRINFSAEALTKDPFFRLSPDILQLITMLLSTSEIHAVRLASSVFASLKLSERFWASRFQPGHEYEYIPEIIDHPPESWRAFYLSLQIWALDDPNGGHTLPREAPSQWQSRFTSSHPAPLANTQGTTDVCIVCESTRGGIRFWPGPIDHNNERHAIGYIHESNMVDIHLPIAQYIQGWELALHTSGVKAMALIYEDGVLSSWAGEPVGTPRWRLAGPPSLSAIKAEFDAIKLVKLSREGSLDELNWLNNCLWYPQVPPTGLLYDWNMGDKPPSKFKLPMTSVFFGEADDMYSSILTEIVIWIFDICYIAGIEFRFTDASHNRHLGNIGPFDQEFPGRRNFPDSNNSDSSVSLTLDGVAGERLKSFEVQHLASSSLSMAPIRTPRRVRFRDQYERPRVKASPTQTSKPNGITILTKKDEVCRFITGTLSRFLKPLEIPPNTYLIKRHPWGSQEIYTIRSVEPILPNTRSDIVVRVFVHHGWVQVIFSMARGLFDRVLLPPLRRIEVPTMETTFNGLKVCAQIGDSIHGQLLASYLKKLGLFELRANGTTDLEMKSLQ